MEKQCQSQLWEESRGRGWRLAGTPVQLPRLPDAASWETLEEKAQKADYCTEVLEARDPGMIEAEPEAAKLSRTLTVTTPLHRTPSKGKLLLVVSGERGTVSKTKTQEDPDLSSDSDQ